MAQKLLNEEDFIEPYYDSGDWNLWAVPLAGLIIMFIVGVFYGC